VLQVTLLKTLNFQYLNLSQAPKKTQDRNPHAKYIVLKLLKSIKKLAQVFLKVCVLPKTNILTLL